METVSKLNPLATCFIPSSMKYQSISSTIFSVPSYEAYVSEYTEAKYRQFPIAMDEQSIGYLKVKAQSNSIRTKISIDPFMTIKEGKETRPGIIKTDKVVKKTLITKPILSTMNEVSGKETPVKPDDGKTSERNCKDSWDKDMETGSKDRDVIDSIDMETGSKDRDVIDSIDMETGSKDRDVIDSIDMETGSKDRDVIDSIDMETGSKDMIVTKLDFSVTNETVINKFFELLKSGTNTLKMLLPFAVRSMLVMEFFVRMGLRTISLDATMTSCVGSIFKPKFNLITFPNKAKKAEIAKKRNDECHCPPMSGWIIPFQSYGNPLTWSTTCDKDYVPASFDDENLKLNQYEHTESNESSSFNDDEITLEQCALELKAIIKDVCDSISVHDEDHDNVPKTEKRPAWETRSAKEIKRLLDPDIIDDGIHPLLQENHQVDTEDTEIPKIQALLEQAFSLHGNPSVQEILPSQSVCNPPCSVWCNKVPSPAKDAYKRFIRNMDSDSTASHKVTDINVLKKPSYKRCFSADDTPKNYDKMLFQSASSMEPKERLLLLHKDPVLFIKQSRVSTLKDIRHKSKSNFFVSDKAATKDNATESSSDKWSLYDGADSMWQPLPNCVPSTDGTQKYAHRKAREMRRQKSVC